LALSEPHTGSSALHVTALAVWCRRVFSLACQALNLLVPQLKLLNLIQLQLLDPFSPGSSAPQVSSLRSSDALFASPAAVASV
jgi:hypothetical protein